MTPGRWRRRRWRRLTRPRPRQQASCGSWPQERPRGHTLGRSILGAYVGQFGEDSSIQEGCHLTTNWVTFTRGRTLTRTFHHVDKEVEEALVHAERKGWRVQRASGHAWGRLYCPFNDHECRCGTHCITSVWSTPKNPGNFARQLRRIVDNCTGQRVKPDGDKK